MLESVVQKLIASKEKGLKVSFETNGKQYFVSIANSLYVTLNKAQFEKVYKNYQTFNCFSK